MEKYICDYWKGEEFDDVLRFPGAQPVSLELKDIETIKKNEYWCCPKLDGERYFLVVFSGKTYMVDRNLKSKEIRVEWLPYVLRKGLILDGEVIDGNKFIIHDAIDVLGVGVKSRDFPQRIEAARTAIGMFRGGAIELYLKKFYLPQDLKLLLEESKDMPTDGLIFYPVRGPIGYKTQMNFFKWKPPGHHTIDFLTRPRGDSLELITWSRGKESIYSTIPMDIVKDMDNYNPKGCVIEFNTVLSGKPTFIPLKVRTDKPRGNNLYTVRKTILNVEQNITLEKLIEHFVV